MLALALCTFAVGVGTGLIVSALLPDRRTLDERFDAACEQALLLREQIEERDEGPSVWISPNNDGVIMYSPGVPRIVDGDISISYDKRRTHPRDRRGRFARRGRK